MKAWHTSGDPYEDRERDYSPAEAAAIARIYPWAAIDSAGDLIVGMYRTRASWGGGEPMEGSRLARQLEAP